MFLNKNYTPWLESQLESQPESQLESQHELQRESQHELRTPFI
jgi:hypothetical protein